MSIILFILPVGYWSQDYTAQFMYEEAKGTAIRWRSKKKWIIGKMKISRLHLMRII